MLSEQKARILKGLATEFRKLKHKPRGEKSSNGDEDSI